MTLVWTLCFWQGVGAQSGAWQPLTKLDTGTALDVRTTEAIDTSTSDGQIFTGVVDHDVYDTNGRLAIPAGATTELIVRSHANNELVLDLDSVTINGQRYAVSADSATVGTGGVLENSGIGANRETAQHVGGGALLGTLLGAITGGAKGAAIGAVVGGAAGAATQVLTRGKTVRVPAETLLNYRLDRALDLGVDDTGYTRDGRHYHSYYYDR